MDNTPDSVGKAVRITALDWTYHSGDYEAADIARLEPVQADIVGVLLRETEHIVTVAQYVFADKSARHITVIPKSVILKAVCLE